MVNVAVLGYGTVGSGVAEVIWKNQELVNKKAETEVNLKYVLDLREFPGDPVEQVLVHDYQVIVGDPEVHVICETMGGLHPAYEFTKEALLQGKSVCTSNKELVAAHGPELLRIAREHNGSYLFEASVGGGIPIIRPLNDCLTAEKIESIMGILNGTTNFILTKMDQEGAEFADVLKEAQEKGYAEKNPAADVEGHDACRKIAILSSLMYGKTVDYQDIYTEGITKISATDFLYAKKMERSIKLLGMSKDENGTCFAMVAPFMIPQSHILYSVNGVFNGIFIHSNMLDDSMYYGRGAGKLPTASAVVGDVIDCARNVGTSIICQWDEEKKELTSIDDVSTSFFVRIAGAQEEVLPKVEAIYGAVEVVAVEGVEGEFAFVVKNVAEKVYHEGTKKLDGILSMIRMEG
ncbi:MAG: homoserine dehydrogenase [Eubacteriales bacterium]